MRGVGPAFDRGLKAMGATPVAIPGSEVYQALATGVVNAAVTDVAGRLLAQVLRGPGPHDRGAGAGR
ncbi:MAG TPA: hypothetical protein VK943_14355, partial [Arenibaculum sp.]|nr:hypothetical protein [Arenibaculum sp.]